ncbi:MAG: peptidase M52, partial [Catenulispora sp.]|nr:peptidase M52 [Catenulispora sp.]
MRAAAPIVIGVGEPFRHDDGVGPAVIAELRRLAEAGALPLEARLATAFGEPTELIELWCGARLAIIVDVAAADPGTGLAAGDVVRWEAGAGA